MISLGLHAEGGPTADAAPKKPKAFIEFHSEDGAEADFSGLDRQLHARLTARRLTLTFAGNAGGTPPELGNAQAKKGPVVQCMLLDLALTNRGETDLEGLFVLSPTVMQSIGGFMWPTTSSAPLKTWYVGFRKAIGKYRKPPTYQQALLLLFPEEGRKVEKMVVNGAGYNFGLIGFHHTFTLEAGASARLPLALLTSERKEAQPAVDFSATLDALKDDILAKLDMDGPGE